MLNIYICTKHDFCIHQLVRVSQYSAGTAKTTGQKNPTHPLGTRQGESKCHGNLWDNTLNSGIDMEIMKLPLNIYRITWKQLYNKHTEIYSLMIDGLFHVKFV